MAKPNLTPVCGIYKLSSPDGKCYVGSSFDIHRRTREHLEDLRRGTHYNQRLQEAWAHWGSLTVEVLEECPDSQLRKREQVWVDRLKSHEHEHGFNQRKQVNSVPRHLEDTKQHLASVMKGNTHLLGHHHTKESRAMMSQSHQGLTQSAETRKKKHDARMRQLARQKEMRS